jgi:hypothetical protein
MDYFYIYGVFLPVLIDWSNKAITITIALL